MTEDRPSPAARALSGRTAWARSLQTPLRVFLRTETGSAAVLVAMTVAALVWINISASSYEAVWGARLSVQLAGAGVSLDLREWVNSGLMTFFFFVFGLEARREFDMGELRQRRRLALPVRGRAGWPDRPGRDLPGVQSRAGGAGLGRGDVNRYRVRAGDAGPGPAPVPGPGPGVPAVGGGRG